MFFLCFQYTQIEIDDYWTCFWVIDTELTKLGDETLFLVKNGSIELS